MTAVRNPKTRALEPKLAPRLTTSILLGLAFTVLASDLAAQRWGERTTLSQRRRAGIAFDPLRNRMVLAGGMQTRGATYNTSQLRETWEWDAVAWTRRIALPLEPTTSDSTRAMFLHPTERRVFLLNANTNLQAMEYQRWDGRTWATVPAAVRPSYRLHFSIAYDEVRRRLVMWGGSDSAGPKLDVAEFDGTTWVEIGAPGPSGRNDAAMAWDGVRGKVVMFGGRTANTSATPLDDMWEWNGSGWSMVTLGTAPPARNQHSMTWDPVRRRVILFGGGTGQLGTAFGDTWEWNGTAWANVTPAVSPPGRAGHGATYHEGRNRIIITCGETASELRSDTWEYDGSTWTQVTPPESPTVRSDHATSYDSTRRQVVLFGGRDPNSAFLSDTWLFENSRWRLTSPAASPAARAEHAMVFDAANGNVVLFGGLVAGVAQNDTWLWDGTTWTRPTPPVSPTARYGHAMAYDRARSRVVLFGGLQPPLTMLNDTWEWTGTTWQQVTPTASPTARADHAMTFDSARNVVLMCTGRTSATAFVQDIWSFNGVTWTNLAPTGTLPTARANAAFDFDPTRNEAFLFGGAGASLPESTTHRWTGTNWVLVLGAGPAARSRHTLTYEPAGRRLLMFGGDVSGGTRRADTWLLSTNTLALVSQPLAGTGCAGGGGLASIAGFGTPAIGNQSFALDLSTARSPTPVSPVFFLLAASQGSVMFGPCRLAVDPATLFYTSYALQNNNLAVLPLPIPPTFNLMGASVFAQCLHIDPPTTLNGLAFSLGSQITIGDY